MVVNGIQLLNMSPIEDMKANKFREFGTSHGLVEVGYDIRIKQEILFIPGKISTLSQTINNEDGLRQIHHRIQMVPETYRFEENNQTTLALGGFVLASAMERFKMPRNLVGIVHDKSTWARQGLSVFNTVIEPNWEGYLTLELSFKGTESVHIPAGAGIAQVIFHTISEDAAYSGKYQNQDDRPVDAIFA